MRLLSWSEEQDWRITWGAVWFQLGRAASLSMESQRTEALPHQQIVDRGKEHAREVFLRMSKDPFYRRRP